MLLYIILIVLFFIAQSEKDIIMTNPKLSFFPRWKWYNRHDYIGKSWLIENAISFIADGFHLWKSITILIPSYFFIRLIDISNYYVIVLFVVAGVYHSIRNGSFFRRGLR